MANICDEIEKQFRKLVKDFLGDEGMERYAKATPEEKIAIADEVIQESDLNLRQAKLMAVAWDRIKNEMENVDSISNYMMDSISGQGARRAGIDSLENRIRAVEAQYFSQLSEMAEKYRIRKLGFDRSRKAQENLVHELYRKGSSGDKDAAQFATILADVFEQMRLRFNRAGGGIKQLFEYNLPQYHDAVKINKVKFDEWYRDIQNWTRKDVEGLQHLSDKQYRKTMEGAFDHLRTDGIVKAPAGSFNPYKQGRIAKRHLHHRILHFKDSDSWIKYAEKYGANDIYNSIMGHIEVMSREIAAMEKFGPNPDIMVKRMRVLAQQQTGRASTGFWAQNTYDDLMGRVHSQYSRVSDAMRGLRNIVTGLKIGKASISAISDLAYFGLTAKLNGMPLIRGYARFFNNLVNNRENRMIAARIAGVIDYSLDRARSARRISEVHGVGASARFADSMVRASGLNYWTNTLEQSFMLEMLGNLADLSKTSFDKLPRNIRKAMTGYGISAEDWAQIQIKPLYIKNGARYLDPMSFGDDNLTAKIIGMVREETDFAVPKPNAKGRALLHQGIPAGTLGGELVRLIGQFKSFPVSVALSHLARTVNLQGYSRLGYAASLLVGTTILGTLAYQAKQFVAGKTPIDWDSPQLWATGFLQGGGTGILGDIAFADYNRLGSLSEFALGPTVAQTELMARLWLGNTRNLIDLDSKTEANFGAAAARTVREAIPNLLWTKLAMDRYIHDQVAMHIDPQWYTRQRSLRRRLSERGQDHWWAPGDLKPSM